MKKVFSFFLILLVALSLTSCKSEEQVRVLRVYNWQDYIDDGTAEENGTSMLDDFVNYYLETDSLVLIGKGIIKLCFILTEYPEEILENRDV